MRRKICSFLKEMSFWGARNSLAVGKISEAQYENQKSSIAMFLFSTTDPLSGLMLHVRMVPRYDRDSQG